MQCLFPITVKNSKTGTYVRVPCGRCAPCLSRRARDWSFRLQAELDCPLLVLADFLTLTYNDDNLVYACDKPVLVKKDLQDFFKRLRKFLIFRYFAVGEYGGQFGRPHYHLLMFIQSQVSIDMYRFYVEKCWDKGFSSHGTITPKSINYVTFYILKQSYDDKYNSVTRPFQIMSKRPFLGETFLCDTVESYIADNHRNIHARGSNYAIPRIFLRKALGENYSEQFICEWKPPELNLSPSDLHNLNQNLLQKFQKHKHF